MSVSTHRPLRHNGTRPHGAQRSVRALLLRVARRIADSPLEQHVLHTLGTRADRAAPDAAPQRPHPSWHLAAGPYGGRRLDATWHTHH
ncbi:hypothetical protein AB0D11_36220 [Streptomyces monashensis]|uniref:hypothetical protein n=1 Tax=Streptomyces monashensis TaxID=1678012 RepID=UPI0034086667